MPQRTRSKLLISPQMKNDFSKETMKVLLSKCLNQLRNPSIWETTIRPEHQALFIKQFFMQMTEDTKQALSFWSLVTDIRHIVVLDKCLLNKHRLEVLNGTSFWCLKSSYLTSTLVLLQWSLFQMISDLCWLYTSSSTSRSLCFCLPQDLLSTASI